jgi:hypothetical protein
METTKQTVGAVKEIYAPGEACYTTVNEMNYEGLVISMPKANSMGAITYEIWIPELKETVRRMYVFMKPKNENIDVRTSAREMLIASISVKSKDITTDVKLIMDILPYEQQVEIAKQIQKLL